MLIVLSLSKDCHSKGYFFDIILMDCNMTIMDGYEASNNLRDMIFKGLIPDIQIETRISVLKTERTNS